MHGILYGVGVGPGDPRLMTFLAAETIKKCEVLAVPARTREQAVSYQIARGLLPELDQKAVSFSRSSHDKGQDGFKRSL